MKNVKTTSKLMAQLLDEIKSPLLKGIQQKGLLAGLYLDPWLGVNAQAIAQRIGERGVITKAVN